MDVGGTQWLSGRLFESRLRSCKYELHRRKTHPDITEKLLTQMFRVKSNKQITIRFLFIK